jgi:hypothetical protein
VRDGLTDHGIVPFQCGGERGARIQDREREWICESPVGETGGGRKLPPNMANARSNYSITEPAGSVHKKALIR